MDPGPADRRDAHAVVDRLREAGHEAWFVGGCVRDELLGRTPREYDVSTAAHPHEVQALFARTVPVGVQFGVILVLTESGPVEVATFRSDDAYVDGRRPTGVRYTTAREDAERRDFTINGLFMDPATGEVIDHVHGREDLRAGVIRAIGEPRERFREDKLRLLRAVRFSATLGFTIEPATWAAVRELASSIGQVSWERIQAELSRILVSGRAAHGFRLLHEAGLLREILPEITAMEGVEQPPEFHPEGDVLVHTFLTLEKLDDLPAAERTLEVALGALLHDVGKPPTFSVAERIRFDGHDKLGATMSDEILRRLRYPNHVTEQVTELVARHMAFAQIRDWREAKLRRFLLHPLADLHLRLHQVDCLACHGNLDTWRWCLERREQFLAEKPRPPRLLTGDDLIAAGHAPAPLLGRILAAVDDERLEGRLATREEALAWVKKTFPPEEPPR